MRQVWPGMVRLSRVGLGVARQGKVSTVTGVTMGNEAVTLVTRDATLDDLSASDYRDIYDELRGRGVVSGREYALSLDQFLALVRSDYSKAQWSKYHNGETKLTRAMRNELRNAMHLSQLPPTVAEATAAASPDAAVWQVGDGPAEHVIMVTTHRPITLHVNGAVTAVDNTTQRPVSDDVTGVTRAVAPRRYYARPTASAAQNERRVRLGVKWAEIIEAGLDTLENGSAH